MNIFVSTVRREPNYARALAEQLRGYPATFVVDDGESGDYLGPHAGRIVSNGNKEMMFARRSQQAAYNYWTCLTTDRTQDALVFEDDVVLKEQWWDTLQWALASVRALPEGAGPFIIALANDQAYATCDPQTTDASLQRFAYKLGLDPSGRTWCSPYWANTSAAVYSKGLLQSGFTDHIIKRCLNSHYWYDVAAGQYCFEASVPIFFIIPQVAQHVGVISSVPVSEKRVPMESVA